MDTKGALITGSSIFLMIAIASQCVGGTEKEEVEKMPSDKKPLTINGNMTIGGQGRIRPNGDLYPLDQDNFIVYDLNLKTCEGRKGFVDINEGASVSIYNESGKLIATSNLEAGRFNSVSLTTPDIVIVEGCTFPWKAVLTEESKFYQVEIGRRGRVNYSSEQLKASGFRVEIGIGE